MYAEDPRTTFAAVMLRIFFQVLGIVSGAALVRWLIMRVYE